MSSIELWVAGLVRSALDMSLSVGRAAAGVRGPLRAWRKRALQCIFEAGDSLRLQFPPEDLGFRYNMRGAAVCLPRAAADTKASASAASAAQNLRSQQGRGLEYVQSAEPGSRLPHCEIRLLACQQSSSPVAPVASLTDASREATSTHDLLDPTSTALLLIIGQGSAAAIWAGAAHELDREPRLFNIVQIIEQLVPGGRVPASSLQGTVVAEDVNGQWNSLREVSSCKCCSPCMFTVDCP